jgi:hypothetical protein
VVVVGDVNSTMACTLAAVKLGVPVAHVEAGLRSFDRSMPEEINRVVTDALADLLLVSEPAGEEHLRREGVPDGRIRYVGNVMIDTLVRELPAARALGVPARLGLPASGFLYVTLHRPRTWTSPRASRASSRCSARSGEGCRSSSLCTRGRARGCAPSGWRRRSRRLRGFVSSSRSATGSRWGSWRRRGWCSPTRAAFRRRRATSASPASRSGPTRSGR